MLVDIGDILGACGTIKRTEKGELSVLIRSFEILTKSLLPLPDKYHDLTDVDKRYRHRYVDMIANPEGVDVFRTRAKGAAGGAEARPFITYHNSLGRNVYLRFATELHVKRMLVGGIEKVYEIDRIFRNEGISTWHNPEFTTIEGTKISLERPWRRETMHNLVKEVTGIDFNEFGNDTEAVEVAAKEAVMRTLGNGVDSDGIFSFETCPSVGHVVNENKEGNPVLQADAACVDMKSRCPYFYELGSMITPLVMQHVWF